MKKILSILASAILLCTLYACSDNAQENSSLLSAESLSESTIASDTDNEASISDVSTSSDIQIILQDDKITVSDNCVIVSNKKVIINTGGTYYISGSLTNGQIYVEAGTDDDILLVLSGVTISNDTEAAIHVENADHTTISLADGTENVITSGTETAITAVDETLEEATGAAIYAKDDLNITGNGSLTVYGFINNGIHSSNDLIIDGGNINVTAVNNGIKGKDSMTISAGTFVINSGGDGLKSDDTTGADYGVINILGGDFLVNSQNDGIQAETQLDISGGSFQITTGEGSSSVDHSESGFGGDWSNSDSDWDIDDESSVSNKGLKSGGTISITGGTFDIDTADDSIHAAGDVIIENGTLSLSSGDDGIHSDTALNISGGNIDITGSYEGLEAVQITIYDGDIDITASDDGMNANGGNGSFGGMTTQSENAEMPNLTIKGGNITVNSGGDGLDSNGNIVIEGGYIIVNGPTNSGNGAIDSGSESGGTCTISGGTILAIGASGMAETFSSNSTQPSFIYNISSGVSAGDVITISDSSGREIFTYTVAKSASSVVFSSADLVIGNTYTLTATGQNYEITLDSVSTGESGSMNGGMGGGRGNMNGVMDRTGKQPEKAPASENM